MSKRDPSLAKIERLWSDLPLSQSEYQTDVSNAERFIRMHGDSVRYCAKLRQWFVWDGQRWVRDARDLAMRLAKETSAAMLQLAKSQENALRFARTSNNRQGLESMLTVAEVDSRIAVEANQFDREPMLLNCRNGILDLRTMELSPHDPHRLITKLCPVEFVAEEVTGDWEKFLTTVFPDAEHRQFLQKWFGYCLTGETREQLMLIFIGSGANGKSTLLETIQSVLGDDFAIQGSPDLLVDKPRDSHPTNRMDLYGRRLVVCTETEVDQKLAESLLKQLTGSDLVRGRQMRQDNWEFRPTHKLILCTNHMPKLSGSDEALWRRIIVVPFTQRFWNPATDQPGLETLRQDKQLSMKLKSNPSAILAWMAAGCRDWQSGGGFQVPESLRQLTDDLRGKLDTVRQFVDECCEVGDSSLREKAGELQQAYKNFCHSRREQCLSPKKLSERLQQLGYPAKKTSNQFYCGLKLKPAYTPMLKTKLGKGKS